jgi:hypothetical protein
MGRRHKAEPLWLREDKVGNAWVVVDLLHGESRDGKRVILALVNLVQRGRI